jgi:hypothetical protein
MISEIGYTSNQAFVIIFIVWHPAQHVFHFFPVMVEPFGIISHSEGLIDVGWVERLRGK